MKTNSTLAVTFFTRLNSIKTDIALIFVRITVNGRRSEISLEETHLKSAGIKTRVRLKETLKKHEL